MCENSITEKHFIQRSLSGLHRKPLRAKMWWLAIASVIYARAGLDANIQPFVQGSEEVTERCSQDDYPCLWQIKNRPFDPVLNGLAEMPPSPQQLMQNLIDTGGQGGVPLGRLPSPEQLNLSTVKHPDIFVRRLACLELPDTRFADLPNTWQLESSSRR